MPKKHGYESEDWQELWGHGHTATPYLIGETKLVLCWMVCYVFMCVYCYAHLSWGRGMSLGDLKISAGSAVPFYRQMFDQVAARIRSGELGGGTKLPSVRELAKETMVSLITVRRVYADLEAAGLIRREQGRGTFVAELDTRSRRREADLEARRILNEAVESARRLGLVGADLRRHIEELLSIHGEEDDG